MDTSETTMQQLEQLLEEMGTAHEQWLAKIESKLQMTQTLLEEARLSVAPPKENLESQELQLVREELSHYKARVSELEQELQEEKQRAVSLEKEEELASLLEQKNEQLNTLYSDNARLKQELFEMEAHRQNELLLEQQARELRKEVEERDFLLERLQQDLTSAQEAVILTNELEAQKQENEALVAFLQERQSLIEQLQQQLEDAQKQLTHKQSLEHHITQQNQEIANLGQQIEEYRSVISEKDSLIESLRSSLDEQEEKIQHRTNELQQALAKNEAFAVLEQDLQSREAYIAEIEQRLADAKALEDTLNHALEAAKDETKHLLSQQKETADRLASRDQDIEVLRSELALARQEREEFQKKSEVLTNELDIFRLDRQSVLSELEEARSKIAAMEHTIEKLTAEKEALQLQLVQDRDSIENAQKLQLLIEQRNNQLDELQNRFSLVDEEKAKLALQIKMLMGQIESLEFQKEEIESLRGNVAKLEEQLTEERNQVLRLKAEIASLKAQKEERREAPEHSKPAEPKPTPVDFEVEKGRRGQKRFLGELLLNAGVLTQEQLDIALSIKAKDPRRRLGTILNDLGYATEEVIAAAISAQLRVRFISDIEREIDLGVSQLVPAHLVNKHRCVPVSLNAGILIVAMANPLDLIAIEDIEIATRMQVEAAIATPSKIDAIIARYYTKESLSSAF